MSAPMPVNLDKSAHSDDDKQIQWQKLEEIKRIENKIRQKYGAFGELKTIE